MLYPSFVVPNKYDTDLWKQGSYFMEICDTIMVDDQEKKKKKKGVSSKTTILTSKIRSTTFNMNWSRHLVLDNNYCYARLSWCAHKFEKSLLPCFFRDLKSKIITKS